MGNRKQNSKTYDLEERTLKSAKTVREFVREFPKDFAAYDDIKQLLRSSGSVGANYIEANNALSKKDFQMRIKICKKEAKESAYWLELLEASNNAMEQRCHDLKKESEELVYIFAAILRNSQ
ncbi:MAG: four helix bundle protein [Phycisphaerae bacterium]|nr:four helix bundle protein [Phycisphaerae bacterium]